MPPKSMLIGILSDIHSNLPALQTVLEDIESVDREIDTFVCLGDVVGYGATPNDCCEIIRDLCEFTIIGNHDAAVAGRMDYSFYYDQARQALDWHSQQVTEAHSDWLDTLAYREDRSYQPAGEDAEAREVAYCHGSPINLEEFEYVFSLHQANNLINHWGELGDINFIGHSHLTKSFSLDRQQGAQELEGPVIDFEAGKKYVVTAGSVGQPRDNDNRACWGLFDTDEMSFTFRRVSYDIRQAAQKIFESELSSDFGKRLFFGI